ncbi:lytic polysaccharide monooxygenase auxiliary activity family 9 protein [Phytohabitans aurantiacus]|uniref:lytic polysaccharide monooxygenase auxiliary activity family 9 protein n=1 Tax=Phytohabitans aurantiacus TaxID=3016789 RepID=UPI0024928A13|nr:lytic polysaccharide monooxygenase [Phytohabitans aurantiacus]
MKVLGLLAVVAGVLLVAPAPASAHGALTNPVSRLAACGAEGDSAGTAACAAARKASRNDFGDWDNLRLPDVDGRDREVVPDGKLCSAGLSRYQGLDLPREDWPATTLTAGADLAFAYRGTIPHKGTFRLFVTRDGYDPTAPLTWSDLETKPFLTAKDPAMRSGSYRIKGELPSGKTGRHLIYTIWQNSDTPDTYYSCSDVVFKKAAAKAAKVAPSASESAPATEAAPPAVETTAPPPAAAADPEPVSATSALPLIGGGAALIVLFGAVYAVLLHRTRSRPDRRG